jgi:D-sedoheptulose 7-phosphate isomerase
MDRLATGLLLFVAGAISLSLIVALATLPPVAQDWGWFWYQTVVPGVAAATLLYRMTGGIGRTPLFWVMAGYSLVVYQALLVGLCIKGMNWYQGRRRRLGTTTTDQVDPVEPAGMIAAVEKAEYVTAAVRYPGDYARMRFQQRIHEEVSLTAAMLLEIAADAALMDEIATVADQFIACMRSGGKVLWCGNGGSAADAQHLAAEFVVRFTVGRPALPSLALTVDTSVLTACANDFGYEQVFARQVEALGRKGDVLVGMSTSGNSPTVLCALETARNAGLATIGFTGASGGKMAGLCDTLLRVPSERTQNIQEAHILFGHIVVGLMEETLYPEKFAAGSK